jgi:hypothetical protein
MNHLNNTKQALKLEKGGKLAFFAFFVILLGVPIEYLTNNMRTAISISCIGMWLYIWALYIGPCNSLLAKNPRLWKSLRTFLLISNILMCVSLMGKLFLG